MSMRLKKLTFALCFMGMASATFAQTTLIKSAHQIEEYKLDNGFRVVLAPNDKENKVFINTVYFTGSLNDPQGKGGLAHLLEHLAFKGTENVKGEEFQRKLDQHTLMTNASTDYYSTKYTNIVRPDQNALNEIIYLEAERMDKLVLQEKFVPSEINIVMREREVRMDQPFAVLMDQMWKAAYGNKSLGRLPIGDLSDLQSIKMNELQKFYREWYAPGNAVMVISGKFDKAAVLKQIDEKFSPIPARSVPAQAQVPQLDSAKIQQRNFMVQKGSDLAKFNIYMNGRNEPIKTALAFSPYLYTMQPSGHLYTGMVENGIATAVQSTTWLDRDFNLVFMGAIYAPGHDEKKVAASLEQGVEQGKAFNETELKRVKSLIQNDADTVKSNAAALGGRLSDYVVAYQGDWGQYFTDLDQVQKLQLKDVNATLKDFLVASHRITGDIKPTPEEQKKAQQQQAAEAPKTLDQSDTPPEPLKDASVYKQEVAQYLLTSQKNLIENEKKIQRGALKNGLKYAFYPVATRDNKTYATLNLDFGSAESLFNQSEIVDLTAYLLLRASKQYSLQDITDKAIDAGGSASVTANGNDMTVQIVAKKEKFEEFFQYIIQVLKNPAFSQREFDLIKSQSLSSLDRPYTEPETVASLTLARLVEKYQPGDLRYHFEPDQAIQQLKAATNEQVQQLYRQYFAMNHAQLAITGEFDAKKMQKIIQQQFAQWNGKQKYQRIKDDYFVYPAQKVHVLSEQREFGHYQALLTLPVGVDSADAPAMIIFDYILGDSQLSSRLGQELREKKALVYGFGSNMQLGDWDDSGALSISANYTAGKSAEVSAAVHKVLQDLLSKGVTEQELEAAKADIMKKRVTALEDERRIHSMLVPQLERDRDLLYRQKRDQAIAALTKADVDAVIKKYIKPEQLVEVMADQYGQAAATSVAKP